MKLMKTCLTAIISSLMIFSPMAYADKWSDQFPHIKATGDIPGDCSYCLLYTSPSPRDGLLSRMPSSA